MQLGRTLSVRVYGSQGCVKWYQHLFADQKFPQLRHVFDFASILHFATFCGDGSRWLLKFAKFDFCVFQISIFFKLTQGPISIFSLEELCSKTQFALISNFSRRREAKWNSQKTIFAFFVLLFLQFSIFRKNKRNFNFANRFCIFKNAAKKCWYHFRHPWLWRLIVKLRKK